MNTAKLSLGCVVMVACLCLSSAGVLREEEEGADHHLVRRQDGGDVEISIDAKHFRPGGGRPNRRPNRPYGNNGYNNGYGNNGYNSGYGNNGYNSGYGNNGYNNGYGNNGYNNGYGNNGFNNGYNGYNNGYGGGSPFGFRSANEDGNQNSVQN